MIIINGKTYFGNVVIVNGRVVGGDSNETCSDKTVDECKHESSEGIRKIIIKSNFPVKISAESRHKKVEAHLYGSFLGDNNPKFTVTRDGNKIFIEAKMEGTNYNNISIFSSASVVINNSSNFDGLCLDVLIPDEMIDEISIESKDNNIDVQNSVNARNISIESKNGNVDVYATFQHLSIDCKNGNIDVDSEAQSDICLEVVNKNGNIDVSIDNIGTSNVSVETKYGSCKNNPRLRGKYIASGSITNKNGNVKFK